MTKRKSNGQVYNLGLILFSPIIFLFFTSQKAFPQSENPWTIIGIKNRLFVISYTISTNRQFVANSYVDGTHAYFIPENTFLYADGFLHIPVLVQVFMNPEWDKIATCLDPVAGRPDG
jgi:predicted metalloprotease with PDZ domain